MDDSGISKGIGVLYHGLDGLEAGGTAGYIHYLTLHLVVLSVR